MTAPAFVLELPDWVTDRAPPGDRLPDPESRMRLAIALAEANVGDGGGPFGAVVAERRSGELLAGAVNRVMAANASIAHAEILALTLAQQRIGRFDLGADPDREIELVTSGEPCVQCFGALFWSGIRSLVCGARSGDAEAAGFDEGPKPADWHNLLEAAGVRVTVDFLREEAARVIRAYAQAGGPIYNPARP